MTYDPNVPQFPSDFLANSQPEMFNNFMALANSWALNHVPLVNSTTAGNHTIIQLLERQADPQTGVTEISVYTKNVPGQTDQTFIEYGATTQVYQYTNYQIYALPQTQNLTQFFTFLPGKVLVYFGTFQNLPNKMLPLLPPVARNIITVSCALNQVAPGGKPYVSFVENDGFITQAIFTLGTVPITGKYSYLIMAGI